MFGGSPPSPPDYSGAAREQAAAGRQLTAEQTYANRPDINTPFGNVRWTPPEYDPWFATGGQPPSEGGPQAPDSRGGVGSILDRYGRVLPGGGGGAGGVTGRIADAVFGADEGGGGPDYGQPPGRWAMNVELSPEMQAALEAQQRIGAERSGLAEEMFGRVRGELGEAPDFGNLPEGAGEIGELAPGAGALDELAPGAARSRAEEALYARATSRLDPQWERRQEQLDVQLRNQGINPGSAAYTQAMSELERGREAAYAGARQEAIAGGGAEAQRELGMGVQRGEYAQRRRGAGFAEQLQRGEYAQTRRNAAIAEQLQRRGWSLNEINALLSGQQIGMPQFPGFSQAGVSQAPNLLGAAQAQFGSAMQGYGAQQAQLQSLLSGGFGLAGAALPFMF